MLCNTKPIGLLMNWGRSKVKRGTLSSTEYASTNEELNMRVSNSVELAITPAALKWN